MTARRTLGAWSARWTLLGLVAIVSLSRLNAERGIALDTMPAHHIKAVPQERWAQVSVVKAMTSVSQLRIVAPDQTLLDVLQLLEGRDISQVPVAAGDRLLG